MLKKFNVLEKNLILSVAFLLLIGFIAIVSVSTIPAQEKIGNAYYYIIRHLFYIITGLSLGLLVFNLKIDFIKKYSIVFLMINIFFLAMVLKFGFSAGGATRWLAIGPITIQPTEFLKLTLLIYFSLWLSKISEFVLSKKRKNKNKNNSRIGFIICSFIFILSFLILMEQKDLSSMMVLFLIMFVIYFVSGTPIWHNVLIFLLGAGGLYGLIKFAPYRIERLQVFLNPNIDPMGIGYQIKQISIAIGSGGLFGLGVGMSRQKFGFLPEAMTDAIFAILSEETGFIGAGLVILCFIVFLWSGFSISKNISDSFSMLLVIGITSWITIQALINIAAMLSLVPLTGIPLPFVSYGGSHIVAELMAIGLLLNVSRKSKIN
jgi:cell division protein FtsW